MTIANLFILLKVFTLFILPVLLIKFRIISKEMRLVLLFTITIIVTTLFFTTFNNPKHVIGMTLADTTRAAIPYIYYILFGIIGILTAAHITGKKLSKGIVNDMHFYILFIPISIAQEFLFHGFLLHTLAPLSTTILLPALLTAFIFGFMHIIYPNSLQSFLLGTLAGLANVVMFVYYPNIIMSSISHSILNWLAVAFTFFTFVEPNGTVTPTSLKSPKRILAQKKRK